MRQTIRILFRQDRNRIAPRPGLARVCGARSRLPKQATAFNLVAQRHANTLTGSCACTRVNHVDNAGTAQSSERAPTPGV